MKWRLMARSNMKWRCKEIIMRQLHLKSSLKVHGVSSTIRPNPSRGFEFSLRKEGASYLWYFWGLICGLRNLGDNRRCYLSRRLVWFRLDLLSDLSTLYSLSSLDHFSAARFANIVLREETKELRLLPRFKWSHKFSSSIKIPHSQKWHTSHKATPKHHKLWMQITV